MKPVMKKAVFLLGSACWLLFTVGFGFLLARYVAQGAGMQFSAGLFSESSVLIGMVHVCGLVFALLGSVAVSAGLWARAFAPAEQQKNGDQ
jgi:hypothetical protein